MAQDEARNDDSLVNRYSGLGDEVAFVLASARDAAAEMREQAKQYSEALLAGTRSQIDDLLAGARLEADKVVNDAKAESERILQSARRQVLNIIDAAQARVETAERAADEAGRRRDEMLQAESELETGVTQVIDALQKQLESLRVRRETPEEVADEQSPRDALSELLAASAAAMLDAGSDDESAHDEASHEG